MKFALEQRTLSMESSRKSTEGFVQWKPNKNAQERGSTTVATSNSGGSHPKRKTCQDGTSGRGLAPSSPLSIRGRPQTAGARNFTDFEGARLQNAALSERNVNSGMEAWRVRKGDMIGRNTLAKDRISHIQSPASSVRQAGPTARDFVVSTLSGMPCRTLQTGNTVRNNLVTAPFPQTARSEEVSRGGGLIYERDRRMREVGSMSSSWIAGEDEVPYNILRGHRSVGTTGIEDAEQGEVNAQNEEWTEDGWADGELQGQSETHVHDFDDEDLHLNIMPATSEGGLSGKELMAFDAEHVEDGRELVDCQVDDESTKRRERRQAQAAREKEGDRRRKAGLRRNYLMVDQYTKKPCGLGVGEWRKELMLLSRDLDPSIGNINKQPPGAVAEIAEWIQHTWEYSEPVKFEFVKEVVARGVTLRRAEIWKKIRNNESKPEVLSDRCWRSLQRQLESDAQMKKSENCSKANAARVNFGRTGPSGEVGVRERLRRKLRRSPEPEEINKEMSRNKGYGGCFKRTLEDGDVMRGSEKDARFGVQLARSGKSNVNVGDVPTAHENDGGGEDDVNIEDNSELCRERGIEEGVIPSAVMNLTAQEISQHPLVLKMMERLEALEGQQKSSTVSRDDRAAEKVTTKKYDIQSEATRNQASSAELEEHEGPRNEESSAEFRGGEAGQNQTNPTKVQDNMDDVELEGGRALRKRGRPSKRGRNK